MIERSTALGLLLAASACAPATDRTDRRDSIDGAILGGTADTTHASVAALVQLYDAGIATCSGTTIATKGHSGIFLTAAHCVVGLDTMTGLPAQPVVTLDPSRLLVVPGDDWWTSGEQGRFYDVLAATPHPDYDGDPSSPYDIAVVQYAGATPASPTTSVLTAADDDLVAGSEVTVVGYGATGEDVDNSRRFSVGIPIAELSDGQFTFDQTSGSGVCNGDSGGPSLYAVSGSERVAGVSSFSDTSCELAGGSVRVSTHEGFISGVVADVPEILDCGACELAVGGVDNVCHAAKLACATENSPCSTFAACLGACTTPACANACATSHPQGLDAYSAYLGCVCTEGCASECANVAACQEFSCGGYASSSQACNGCLRETCCEQAAECGADATCTACVNDPTPANCASNQPYAAFTTCLSSCDGNPCGAPAPGMGGSGSGGSAGSGGSPVGEEGGAGGASNGNGGTTSTSGGRAGAPSTPAAGRDGDGGSAAGSGEGPADAGSAGNGGESSADPGDGAGQGPTTDAAGAAGEGPAVDGGDGDDVNSAPAKNDCSCSTPGAPAQMPGFLWLGLACIGLGAWRRQRVSARGLG